MLTDDQSAELTQRVLSKIQWMRTTAVTRAYARDLAGLIVDEWQTRGQVPMAEFSVEVILNPFSIHVDYVPGHEPAGARP